MINDDKHNINYKEDSETEIKYMDPLKIIKLPLSFAGSVQFNRDILKLNKNISEKLITNEYRIKYKIIYNQVNNLEVEVLFVLQEDPSIVIYKFKDKLIVLPKLDITEILIERTIMSKQNVVYLIDCLHNQILVVKNYDYTGNIKKYI